MIINVIHLPVLALVIYSITVYYMLVCKTNMFFYEKSIIELKCYHYDVPDVDILNILPYENDVQCGNKIFYNVKTV